MTHRQNAYTAGCDVADVTHDTDAVMIHVVKSDIQQRVVLRFVIRIKRIAFTDVKVTTNVAPVLTNILQDVFDAKSRHFVRIYARAPSP